MNQDHTPDEGSTEEDQSVNVEPWHTGLSDQHRVFIEEYVKDFNGAAAARRAKYSEHTAKEQASRLLTSVNIRNALDAYLDERSMGTSEAIDKLTTWGRGSLEPFLNSAGEVDITSAEARANYVLIREFEQTKTVRTGENYNEETVRTRIKINDPMAATVKILEVRGKLINRTDVTSKGKQLQSGVILYLPDNGRQNEQPTDH